MAFVAGPLSKAYKGICTFPVQEPHSLCFLPQSERMQIQSQCILDSHSQSLPCSTPDCVHSLLADLPDSAIDANFGACNVARLV
jgi:hypothetical protein